jgi:protoporphyrinogen oxidase
MTAPTSAGIAVLGAGPAGLTAAHVLGSRGRTGVVFEADDQVGGIAKTVEHHGFRFDLGGHRFFTKLPWVQEMWERTLGDEFLVRPRLSRIYYRGGFFAYPLRAEDVVRRLGIVETCRCLGSYAAARVRRREPPETFEDWVTARFGQRLYDAFFREYTEKVWGIPGSEIQAEWAAQRIRNLSFWTALTSALRIRRTHVTSLIEEFHYPRLGPGQMWERLAGQVEARGVPVRLGHRVSRVVHGAAGVESVEVVGPGGATELVAVAGVVSSIPLTELVLCLDPLPPDHVVDAARSLRYRDLLVVGLISTDPEPFPDNWIYLHDPGTRAGRVQNFGAWSPGMTRPGYTSLGAEYFCFEGDETWSMPDHALVELAKRELGGIGLVDPQHVVDGVVIRVPRAYPMYDRGYAGAVETLRQHVSAIPNLETVGRNGLHRYNNQDHSMWTAVLGTLNLVDGAGHDVWSVNADAEYLEEGELQDPLDGLDRLDPVATVA